MGFGRFVAVRSASYLLALVATVSILYVGTYSSVQSVIQASATDASETFERQLIASHRALSSAQMDAAVASFKESYLAQFGFNQPLPVKFALQLYNLFQFHLGTAFFLQAPDGSKQVVDLILAYLPNTILLFTTATLVVILAGAAIGLVAGRKAGGKLDRVVPAVAVISSSFPSFWVGFLLIAYFAYTLDVLPTGGITSVPPPTEVVPRFLDLLAHMALPLASILLVSVGGFAYVARSLVVSTMGEDFVTTAKARGISERSIVFKHVLRTASPSLATQSILLVTGSIGGGLTTEVIFRWPGLGLLTYMAIGANDLPVIIGTTFVITIVLYVGLYVGELTYGLLDPRIRTGD